MMKSVILFLLLGIASGKAYGFARPLIDPNLRAALTTGDRIVFGAITGVYDGMSTTELSPGGNGTLTVITPPTDNPQTDDGHNHIPGYTIWLTGNYSTAAPISAHCPSALNGKIALSFYHYQTRSGASATFDRKSSAQTSVHDRFSAECKRDALLAMGSAGALKFVIIYTHINGLTVNPSTDGICNFDMTLVPVYSCGVCATGTPGC